MELYTNKHERTHNESCKRRTDAEPPPSLVFLSPECCQKNNCKSLIDSRRNNLFSHIIQLISFHYTATTLRKREGVTFLLLQNKSPFPCMWRQLGRSFARILKKMFHIKPRVLKDNRRCSIYKYPGKPWHSRVKKPTEIMKDDRVKGRVGLVFSSSLRKHYGLRTHSCKPLQ